MLTRRDILIGSLGLGGATLFGQSRRQWNVLFLAVDDLRPQLGCYGDAFAKTPNIDALARRGIVFDRAYCQQALCGPSRASLLTGLRPDTTRVYNLDTSFRAANPAAVTLPQYFKQHGYHTEAIGKIFHNNEINQDPPSWSVPARLNVGPVKRDQYALEKNRGDDWGKTAATEIADVPDEAYLDGRIAADAVATLRRVKDQRFFLAVGFHKPHLPFAAPKKYWDLYHRADLPLAPNQQVPKDAPPMAVPSYSELRSYSDFPKLGPMPEGKQREAIHGYYAATSFTDTNVGKVLHELDSLGLSGKTIVVLFGDHGWHLGEQSHWGKITDFEICTRAPLILCVPGQTRGPKTEALVEFVDIYPTLAELCSLPASTGLEGISMAPLVKDPKRPWKKAVFSQYPRIWPEKSQIELMGHSMRTDRYRYTEWADAKGQIHGVEMYDHSADGRETVNLAGRPEQKDRVGRLGKMLKAGWRAALPDSASAA